jgi:hypothetical protein
MTVIHVSLLGFELVVLPSHPNPLILPPLLPHNSSLVHVAHSPVLGSLTLVAHFILYAIGFALRPALQLFKNGFTLLHVEVGTF